MHQISNERALAHWTALKALPAGALNSLRTRFLKEHPLLAFLVLPENVAKSGPEAPAAALEDLDNPQMQGFWRITTSAAIASEILCREAGRPLRPLAEDEVEAIFTRNFDLMDQMCRVGGTAGEPPHNIFSTCAQPHLLSGVVVAHLGRNRFENQTLARETLMLRAMIEGLHLACGDAPPTEPRSWDAERIKYALASQGDPLRREAVAACDDFRNELVPPFKEELDGWISHPEQAAAEDVSLGYHALFLLARWREASAWSSLRQLVAMPDADRDALLGDFVTEEASVVLAMIGGHQPADLMAMVEDDALETYARVAALDALTCLVAWGEFARDRQVSYLEQLLTTRIEAQPENELIRAAAVCAVCDLEAWELRPVVEAAFARGVVDEDYIDRDFFDDIAEGRFPGRWEEFCRRHQPINDVADATPWLDTVPEFEPLIDLAEEGRIITTSHQPYVAAPKIGRNDPCPCGSGKKYKKCCGK